MISKTQLGRLPEFSKCHYNVIAIATGPLLLRSASTTQGCAQAHKILKESRCLDNTHGVSILDGDTVGSGPCCRRGALLVDRVKPCEVFHNGFPVGSLVSRY